MRFSDVFSDIDDKTAERLSAGYPVLDGRQKERLYAMSKRKYEINAGNGSNEVSGVERYSRPKWYKAVSIAAAAVLVVAGIGGSTALISRYGRSPADSTGAAVTESATLSEEQAASIEAAKAEEQRRSEENIAEAEKKAEAARAEDEQKSIDAVAGEMTAAFRELMYDIRAGHLEVDETEVITRSIYSGDYEHQLSFYRITDPDYPSWEAVEKRCYEVFDKELGKSFLEDWHHADEDSLTDSTFIFTGDDGFCYSKEIHDANKDKAIPEIHEDQIKGTHNPDGTITTSFTITNSGSGQPYDIETILTIVNTGNGWRIGRVDERQPAGSSDMQVSDSVDADAVAREMTDEYKSFLCDLWGGNGGSLEVDKSAVVTKTVRSYDDSIDITKEFYRITDPRYRTWADMERRCFEVFDTELGTSILSACNCTDETDVRYDTVCYSSEDGLFIDKSVYEGAGIWKDWDQDVITGELAPDGSITTTLTMTYTDCAPNFVMETSFRFVNTENGWRINKADEEVRTLDN